jgi:membrane protease YdiL (CAAX protease family)
MKSKLWLVLKGWYARLEAPEAALILLVAPIILTLWVYYGKQANFAQFFDGLQGPWEQDVAATVYEYLAAFILMFGIPALMVKGIFKKPLRDFGLQRGDVRAGLRWLMIGTPVALLAALVGSMDPAMRAEYPLAKSTVHHVELFLIVEGFYLVYYLAWEFFFRGFMLFGLEKPYGMVLAILVQTIPSAIVHIGKPFSESFSAIFAGLAFGYVAMRTRSIFYPMLLHALVGIGADVFIALRL